jgi:tRNA-uridine 2-sulfurtransferase
MIPPRDRTGGVGPHSPEGDAPAAAHAAPAVATATAPTSAPAPGRVLVAMSGGVDSSLAAALLVAAGHDVIGVTMKTFCYQETPTHGRTCCGLDGILDARRVAERLDIPHYVFDVEEDFTRDVIDNFVSEYAAGRTPNPCVRCNANTKFRDLLRRGRALGCEAIATGHYVRIAHHGDGESHLLRGLDRGKDQAYFLWGLPREMLPLLRFPVGELTKSAVREHARALELVTADKPESQEICFVPSGDYREFLTRRLGEDHPALRPGPLVDQEGNRVGEHPGYAGFTPGQRKGLGGGFQTPLYVLETRPETREVVVGPQEALNSTGVRIEGAHWLTDAPPSPGTQVEVQLRHRARGVPARVEEAPPGELRLRFDVPGGPVSPGQSAVVFHGDRVLGGGPVSGPLP